MRGETSNEGSVSGCWLKDAQLLTTVEERLNPVEAEADQDIG